MTTNNYMRNFIELYWIDYHKLPITLFLKDEANCIIIKNINDNNTMISKP